MIIKFVLFYTSNPVEVKGHKMDGHIQSLAQSHFFFFFFFWGGGEIFVWTATFFLNENKFSIYYKTCLFLIF